MTVQPLPYHQSLVDYFRTNEPSLWEWFSSDATREKSAESLRLELLKSTYRLPEQEHARLYELGREAAKRLAVDAPLTFYQAVDYGVMNAGMCRLPGEAHIVLCGPIQEKFDDDELIALLGHELTHHQVWTEWNGDLLVVDEILASLTEEDAANPAFAAAERLFQLYTEVFCDRGALHASNGDCLTVIAVLIRMETSLDSIRPESFLEQVDEIFDNNQSVTTAGLTHPEAYIRAKAVQLWADRQGSDESKIDAEIGRMLEGPVELDQLDLIGRKRVEAQTRQLLNTLLAPSWMRTETNLNHAKLFFPEYEFDEGDRLKAVEQPERCADSLLRYFCYVMLDFATADRGLEQMPLAQAVDTARRLGLEPKLAPLVQKELRLRKKQYAQLVEQAESVLADAAKESPEP